MKKRIENDYGTHVIEVIYSKSKVYCPQCGKQEVWIEEGPGDYYEGPVHDCTSCFASFSLPSVGTNSKSTYGIELINQLKNGPYLFHEEAR